MIAVFFIYFPMSVVLMWRFLAALLLLFRAVSVVPSPSFSLSPIPFDRKTVLVCSNMLGTQMISEWTVVVKALFTESAFSSRRYIKESGVSITSSRVVFVQQIFVGRKTLFKYVITSGTKYQQRKIILIYI